MLFVFERLNRLKFCLIDTPVSLDIIFDGENGCVVLIAESTSPMSDQRVTSGEPVKYVVEVRAGFAERFHIDKNTCIQWRRLETSEKRTE